MDFGRGEGDQIFRILLEGSQYFLRFTGIERLAGNAIPMAVHFISSVAHQEGKTSGKMLYHNLLRSGEELRFLSMQGDDNFKQFAEEAKKYGVLYSVVKIEPNGATGEAQTGEAGAAGAGENQHDARGCVYEVAIKASDAAKINRIIENLGLNSVSMTPSEEQPAAGEQVVDLENRENTPDVNQIINNLFSTPERVRAAEAANPLQAADQHSASVASLTARRGIPESDRPSVKEKMATAQQLQAERDKPQQQQQMMAGDFLPNLMGGREWPDEETEEERRRPTMRPASDEDKAAAFGAAFGAAWAAATGAAGAATQGAKQGMVAEESAFLK